MNRALSAVFLVAATSCAAGVEEPPTGSSTSSGSTSASSSSKASSSASTSGSSSSSTSSTGGMGGASSSASTSTSASSSSASSGGAGGCAPYEHTIAIDGVDDFAASEKPTTTSAGYTARVTWDDTYLYVGMEGPDVASNSATKWLLVYLSGPAGSTTGVAYNNQSPTLPFSARWHLRWRANNTFTQGMQWNGAAWVDAMWDLAGDVFQSGSFIEVRIARADLGSPTTLGVHLSMINEVGGGEFTFAGVPSTSFLDKVDPDYTKYFEYDLTGCDAPSAYLPQ